MHMFCTDSEYIQSFGPAVMRTNTLRLGTIIYIRFSSIYVCVWFTFINVCVEI